MRRARAGGRSVVTSVELVIARAQLSTLLGPPSACARARTPARLAAARPVSSTHLRFTSGSHVLGGWTAARSFEELFDPEVMVIPGMAGLMPRFSLISLDLALLSDEDLKARTLASFQKLALWLLRDGRNPACLLGNFETWRPLMIQAGRSRYGRDIIRALIEYMFRVIDPLYRDELHAKIRTLGRDTEEIVMTIAEQIHEEGRQEGRIATLRSQLLFKFQTLDAAAEARLQAATPEAIDRYLQRVLFADSLAAVFAE